ncbi:hypothetical protein T01_7447 [Trichinella spiralis]|uniref:Uncharacterized protein n=1 Tax=Trichinella spiralis TaxID=6334 RepID=A0A0V1BDE9_TRISP|nr:hypothetical protein T01_7447 [Trichinella spiralis]
MLQPEKDEKESSQQSTVRLTKTNLQRIKIKEAKWKNVPEEKKHIRTHTASLFFWFFGIDQWIFPAIDKTLTETAA